MVINKGVYGSAAGIRHAAHQAIGTFIVTVFFIGPILSSILAVLDFLTHYHIDWFKSRFGPRGYKDKHYWVWFGTNQFLHHLTYILFIILIVLSDKLLDFSIYM